MVFYNGSIAIALITYMHTINFTIDLEHQKINVIQEFQAAIHFQAPSNAAIMFIMRAPGLYCIQNLSWVRIQHKYIIRVKSNVRI